MADYIRHRLPRLGAVAAPIGARWLIDTGAGSSVSSDLGRDGVAVRSSGPVPPCGTPTGRAGGLPARPVGTVPRGAPGG